MANITYDGGVGDTLSNLTVTGTLTFTTSGGYFLEDSTINAVGNTSLGVVTLEKVGTTTINAISGDDIIIVEPNADITLTGLISGSQVVGFETGTQTEVYRNNNTGDTIVVPDITYGTYDYTIMREGYFPQRVTDFSGLNLG